MSCKIKDLCERIGSGGTPSRKNKSYYDLGNIKWLKTKELDDIKIYDTEEKITEEGLKKSSAKLYPKDTIVMAMYGATVGKLGIIKEEMCTNQACCNMVVDSNKCDYKFLYYSLLYNRESIINLANGAAQQNLSVGVIGDYEINLPSLEEQVKIANILSSLDDKIELNNEMNKTLEEMAQSIFKRWFVDFEFPSGDGKPYKSSGGEMVDSELGMIPKGWEVKEFNKIADFKYGKMPNKNDIVDTGFPIFSGYKITGYYKKYMFEEKQLIVVARGVGGTGDVKFSPRKCFLTNLSIAVIIRDNEIIKEYLYYYLNNSNLKSLDSGSAQSQITITNLSKFKIINPNKDIILKFHNFISTILKIKDNLESENQDLIETRDNLLPKLMCGEIKV